MFSSDDNQKHSRNYDCNKGNKKLLIISPSRIEYLDVLSVSKSNYIDIDNGIYLSPILYILFVSNIKEISNGPFENMRRIIITNLLDFINKNRKNKELRDIIAKTEYAIEKLQEMKHEKTKLDV